MFAAASSAGGLEAVAKELVFGDDNRLTSSILTWSSGQDFHGRLRAAADYDGLGRVAGLVQTQTTQPSVVDDWRDWRDGEGDQPALSMRSYWRNDLGSITTDRVDGERLWRAQRFPNGPGVESVRITTADGGVTSTLDVPLSWDSRGRLVAAGEMGLSWTGDDLVREVTVQELEPGRLKPSRHKETRRYDAFGRAVVVERDGAALERVFVGDQVLRELSECGERVWWPSGGLDRPAT